MPPGLALHTFAGQAWLGITPFWISRLRARGLPPIPGTARFAEINVRTYVRGPGGSGVLFLSLDAANILAVLGAQIVDHLPYFNLQAGRKPSSRRIRCVSHAGILVRPAPSSSPATSRYPGCSMRGPVAWNTG